MTRIATLNVNHRTHAKRVPPGLVDALLGLDADVWVLTEYVEGAGRADLRDALTTAGFGHFAVSPTVPYAPGRWQNQVLVASKEAVVAAVPPTAAPDRCGDTNILCVRTMGLSICGVRAPAYVKSADWYGYWAWLRQSVDADVVIGDLNADPARMRKWDRVLQDFTLSGGWVRATPDGPWSYAGTNGSRASLDHVLVRGGVTVRAARYVADPFVPQFTDHAALVVDIDR